MYVKQFDNVLSIEKLNQIDEEISKIKWNKIFDRAGSYMLEDNDLNKNPVLRELYYEYSKPEFLKFIEDELKIEGVLPDPYLVGSGYSQIKDSGDLKPHIDFNWNDRIKLHRVASYIIYLSDVESGGEIEFIDLIKVKTKRNMAILFEHSENIRHLVHPVKGVRNAVRFFYYSSKQDKPNDCHRSLYGIKDSKAVDVL